MKKIGLLIISLLWLGWGYASNTVQLSSAQGHPGDTVTLTLAMDNSDAVVALQTMIPLCGQLTYVPGSCVLTDRGSSHYVSATVLRDTLRIYSYSMSLTPYSGNSGALLTFRVVLKKEPATYTLPLCSTLLSSATGASLAANTTAGAVTILAPKIALSTSSINYGHIPIRSTYTQNVTVRNVGNEPLMLSSVSFSDNTLSVANATLTIPAGSQQSLTIQYAPTVASAVTYQAVFHSNAHVGDSMLTILADPFSVNELRPLYAEGETDSIVTISLRMNNMDSIVGLQTKIILPEALTYIQGSFQVSAERSNGHLASAGLSGDTLVMLITHLQNLPLHGGDGVVATFQLQLHGYGYYTLNLIQTALSDAAGQNVLSAVYSNRVQIYSPSINCANTMDLGNTSVTEPVQQSLTVRNNGNATLVISQVVFTNSDFSLVTSLPVTISAWQSSVLDVEYHGTQEGPHSGLMAIYSNDPFTPMKQVALTASRYEPNYLKISSDENAPVSDAAVFIDLDNYSAITALQMDVEYPWQHYTVAPGDIHLTERCGSHLVTASAQNDSTLRVLILSMQNTPITGNSGAVAKINLHPADTTDAQSYPLRLRNVLTGGLDGRDRLRSYDSVVYIATRIVYDTTYLDGRDTIYVHDTTFVDVPYPVHDTTYVGVPYPVHDTTYVEVPYTVHDTNYVYLPEYDTTYIWQYDTIYVILHDTVTVTEPLTWYNLQVLSDDVNKGLAAGNGQFPEGTDVEIAAIPLEGNRFLQWSDGSQDNPRVVTVNSDMIYTVQFTTVGVEDHPRANWTVTAQNGEIVVRGAEGYSVRVYDDTGRLVHVVNRADAETRCFVTVSGIYLVQVDGGTARKVTVIR